MTVTRQVLGHYYVVGAGAVLGAALLAVAVATVGHGPVAALVALAGLVPSLALVGAHYWLPRSDLEGHQVWTIAEWCGLGTALATLSNVAVLAAGAPLSALTPVLFGTSVAVGAGVGVLVGATLEFRRTARRHAESNDVLHRILRHNLRNDLTVVIGHLEAVERRVDGPAATSVERAQRKVDDVLGTVDKARHVDLALTADGRTRRPVDVVPWLRECVAAVEDGYPEAEIQSDLPDAAWVHGDWLIGTALENLLENAVEHGSTSPDSRSRRNAVERAAGTPKLEVSVRSAGETVTVRISDEAPPIPRNERIPVSGERETPLEHSTGVGLWLVRWIVQSYGGSLALEYPDDGGNAVVVELPAARPPRSGSVPERLRALAGRLRSLPGRLRTSVGGRSVADRPPER